MRVVVSTGAGISAESGVPTFRGPEGYWTVGAREYRPQELATLAAFGHMPREVWRWYLYRLGVCRAAQPNPAHLALAQLESHLQDRFRLVTQNVDGLHLRAGNSWQRTHHVHGNIEYMRCTEEPERPPLPLPADLLPLDREAPLTDEVYSHLRCDCGALTRPHVLWFDEYYDEQLYRSQSAVEAAAECDLLIVVGTSGAAHLPYAVAEAALSAGAILIDVNPAPGPFRELAARSERGVVLEGPATEWLPRIVRELISQDGESC